MNKKLIAGAIVLGSFIFAVSAFGATFTTTLKIGSRGESVRALQVILNSNPTTLVAELGAGSPGKETSFFGFKTKRAVIKFQNKYASDVLTPDGLFIGTGFVGARTIAKLNSFLASITNTISTETTNEAPQTTSLSLFQEKKIEGGSTPLVVKNVLPVRLKIPSIKVDAMVESVGLTLEGAMDVPKGPDEVAWFDLGVRPGEVGSAVVAGHTNWRNGRVAVFDNLYKLSKGDKIYVEDSNGETLSFIVRESRIYDPDATAPEVFSSDSGIHFNLVTCFGDWDTSARSSSKRLVVFTDLIN